MLTNENGRSENSKISLWNYQDYNYHYYDHYHDHYDDYYESNYHSRVN